MDSAITCISIGTVLSPLQSLDQCPRFEGADAPDATLHIKAEFAEALHSLTVGQSISVLTWLHKADREMRVTQTHGSPAATVRGVFNTRSPNRPNPIGLHGTRILAITPQPDASVHVQVAALEVLHGTPLLDIKTDRMQRDALLLQQQLGLEATQQHIVPELLQTCALAWQRGLFAGVNGNASVRLSRHSGDLIIITASGTAKGRLHNEDLSLLALADGRLIHGKRASTEEAMHRALYLQQPSAQAILHTHPPLLLALSMRTSPYDFLRMPVYEAEQLRNTLAFVAAEKPGSHALAQAVADAAGQGYTNIWMQQHGLCTWGETLAEALNLAEELEHLARMQLATLACV